MKLFQKHQDPRAADWGDYGRGWSDFKGLDYFLCLPEVASIQSKKKIIFSQKQKMLHVKN
jgi:hypothetical protein